MKILLTGGGTAGHVNPALAIAGYVKEKHPDAEIRYMGAEGGIEEKLVTRAGYPLDTFPLAGLSRKLTPAGIRQNISALSKANKASKKARDIMEEFKPDLVVGTGGYASFPAIRAAASKKIPCMMLEVNATPGVVVKKMASRVDCVMTSFDETAKLLPHAKKIVMTGSPVRGEILKARPNGLKARLFGEEDKPLVVSFWGSVGALYMNRKMCRYLQLCAEENKFNVVHAAGAKNYQWMPEEIEKLGVKLENCRNIDLREYIFDMEQVLCEADLVICRAGASTMAELCAAGKPAIIVPSPYVADNHQEKNARVLEKHGAAVVVTEAEATGDSIYQTVCGLLDQPEKLREMGANAKKLGKTDALEQIYQCMMHFIN
ncbi:undecaprenyldiphospho-muramoylpentapeptide beta-N-acetylglucosaminyltransferase [Acidaminobacterium chupaoyuni]